MSGSNHILTCPKCQTPNTPKGKAMTLAMVCSKCNAYFRRGTWNRNITSFANSYEPAIPLGSKGKIDGTLYEVMGFVVKKETKYKFLWREFLLFNPFSGYAFLSEYDGHWNIVWPLEDDPRTGLVDGNFYYTYKNEQHYFQLFQKYNAEVVYAKGEFFFDIVDITDSTVNSEFISPPYMLALEKSEDSYLWCMGEYLTRAEISTAFNVPQAKLPPKSGIGYTQPLSTSFSQASLIKYSAVILFAVIVMQIFFSNSAADKVVFRQTFTQSDMNGQKVIVTPSFTLEGGSKSLEIDVYAPVSNGWFFAEFSLIDETNGIEHNFTKDVEYYHGVEDGESWSEGSVQGEAFISQIPGGKYHLNIYPEFSLFATEFTVTVRRDVPTLSNFFITLGILLLFPVIYFIRKRMQEQKRWSESDYSPFDTE